MSALAQKHQALNLSQGFPDFAVDPVLIDLVHKYMQAGHNQYAPMAGVPELRQAIVDFTQDLYGATYHPDKEITVTAGATQGIATAIAATIREGDEVVVFSPAYDCYLPMIELNGGVPITVKLEHPSYSINWQEVKQVVNHRTKMILINTPHNPSGSVLMETDLKALAEIVQNSGIVILADEVYEHIVFNGAKHLSIRSHAELRKRAFVMGSLGKSLHVTGWKIGYCMAPENLMRAFQKVHQYQIFSTNHAVQLALAEYLNHTDLRQIGSFYQQKQKAFEAAIAPTAFKPLPTYGSYFQLLDYSAVSQEAEVDFAHRLTKEYGVASIPVSPFYRFSTDNKVLRFCFAKNEETLEKAGKLLAQVG
jgi:methionine aminotransferase